MARSGAAPVAAIFANKCSWLRLGEQVVVILRELKISAHARRSNPGIQLVREQSESVQYCAVSAA